MGDWNQSKNIFVAKVLVNKKGENVPLRLVNMADNDMKIEQGQTIAQISPILEKDTNKVNNLHHIIPTTVNSVEISDIYRV